MSTDVVELLRAADPAARMPAPDADDRERLRRAIVATRLPLRVPWWRRLRGRSFVVLVAGAVVLGSGTVYASEYGAHALWPPFIFESDNPSHLDAPGTGSLAQTEVVARRYAEALSAEKIPGAGLYAADATCDYWPLDGGEVRGAGNIGRFWYESYHPDGPDGGASWWHWSKSYHLLLAPGLAVYEGVFSDSLSEYSTPDLVLIAVDGGRITHEEVFLAGNGLTGERPVTFCDAPPEPEDTAEVAGRVGAAVGEAFATRDRGALRALVAPDVLFRETAAGRGQSGREGLLAWFDAIGSSDVVQIKNDAPIVGPGWAVLRWTARRVYTGAILPNGISETANGATVVEVRGGKVVRIMLYGDSADGNVLLPPQ
jgi:hypothetical protein